MEQKLDFFQDDNLVGEVILLDEETIVYTFTIAEPSDDSFSLFSYSLVVDTDDV